MNFGQIYRPGHLALSIELFPPKTAAGDAALMRNVARLAAFAPDFLTCTYGAGGSTRQKTLEIVSCIKRSFGIPVATHLTVVGSNVDQLRDYLQQAAEQSIDFVVALRGDPPQGQATFEAAAGGFAHASQLVELIRREFPRFGVAVAGYPEKHQEAPSFDSDLAFLKQKVDAGGDVVLTQLFYDNQDFLRFRDACSRVGICAPVVPGLLPVLSFSQVQRITSLCGARLPPPLVQRLGERDDPDWQQQVGIEHAIEQVQGLIAAGVPGLHFYVLNQSRAMSAILDSVPLRR